ncbi:subtilisin-like serine protease pepC [Gigantopelta aegis]|uniref:subtilisin-like serine protease pepC n=1 Tax=Gigantopelta aegis TaxID=1735272 RepID=UPI001B88A829|nr:subtilisin-like serine protease pepC [Gigantopelta aegis]
MVVLTQIPVMRRFKAIAEIVRTQSLISWALDRIDHDNYYGTNQKGRDCDWTWNSCASLACGKHYGVAKKANCYSVRVLGCSGSAHGVLLWMDLILLHQTHQ